MDQVTAREAVASFAELSIEPLASGFAAEIAGITLEQNISADLAAEIKHLWCDYPVLVFPNQRLGPDSLSQLTAQLGEFGHDPYVAPINESSNVIEVRREPQETTPIFGQSWHSDWSFQPEPPSGTLLSSQIIPPTGGDTVFASGYRAYEALSPAMQAMLEPLNAVHTARMAYGPEGLFARDDDSRSMKIVVSPSAEKTCVHPIVRRHPQSGRKALFLNHVYTVAIDGFKTAESTALLGYLFKHMTQSAFLYRHKWQENMLVLWDNRCLIHYADGGYEGHLRLLYRTTMAGERPRQNEPVETTRSYRGT